MVTKLKEYNNEPETIKVELTKEEFKKLSKLLEMSEEEKEEIKVREEQAKNANFIQLYKDHMPELRWLMTKHSLASNILFFILEHMDNRNSLVCSYTIFEDYFEKHRSTIYRAIKILQDNGFLDILRVGTSNVYIVNENLAWTDKNTNKRFSKYDGKILVSHTENKDHDLRSQYDKLKALKERENL